MSALGTCRADLLVRGEQDRDLGRSASRATACREDDSAFHVEHAGPGRVVIVTGKGRPPVCRPATRCRVAEEQDLRLATARPVEVRPGHARDELGRRAEPALDQLRDSSCRALDGVELQRRRLDVDQGLEIAEQHGGTELLFVHGSERADQPKRTDTTPARISTRPTSCVPVRCSPNIQRPRAIDATASMPSPMV